VVGFLVKGGNDNMNSKNTVDFARVDDSSFQLEQSLNYENDISEVKRKISEVDNKYKMSSKRIENLFVTAETPVHFPSSMIISPIITENTERTTKNDEDSATLKLTFPT
jgi:hypothetical protein